MNTGFINEYDFVDLFNKKEYKNLDDNSKELIGSLFRDVKDDDLILCWKNRINQKADIFVKIGNSIKGISLKCGNSNSLHQESIQEFKMFLAGIGVSYKAIDYYTSYQYGYMRDGDKILKDVRLSANKYKSYYQDEIDFFNNELNSTKKIMQCVDRFIIRGRYSDYDIDALIHGTPDDYSWILKNDLYDLIMSQRNNNFTSPHVGNLTIGPKKRNLLANASSDRERFFVCVRWNFIREDIDRFKNHS